MSAYNSQGCNWFGQGGIFKKHIECDRDHDCINLAWHENTPTLNSGYARDDTRTHKWLIGAQLVEGVTKFYLVTNITGKRHAWLFSNQTRQIFFEGNWMQHQGCYEWVLWAHRVSDEPETSIVYCRHWSSS